MQQGVPLVLEEGSDPQEDLSVVVQALGGVYVCARPVTWAAAAALCSSCCWSTLGVPVQVHCVPLQYACCT
jgi:hypothetical protein